jgi:hypothetical protein
MVTIWLPVLVDYWASCYCQECAAEKERNYCLPELFAFLFRIELCFSLKDWVKNIGGRKVQGLGGICCKIKTGRIRCFFWSDELPFFHFLDLNSRKD